MQRCDDKDGVEDTEEVWGLELFWPAKKEQEGEGKNHIWWSSKNFQTLYLVMSLSMSPIIELAGNEYMQEEKEKRGISDHLSRTPRQRVRVVTSERAFPLTLKLNMCCLSHCNNILWFFATLSCAKLYKVQWGKCLEVCRSDPSWDVAPFARIWHKIGVLVYMWHQCSVLLLHIAMVQKKLTVW